MHAGATVWEVQPLVSLSALVWEVPHLRFPAQLRLDEFSFIGVGVEAMGAICYTYDWIMVKSTTSDIGS